MTLRPVAAYSLVVRAGGWLVCSGQVGQVDGVVVGGGIAEQTRQALENLRSVLAGERATLDDVVKTTVFLVDIADFSTMNEVYADVFGDHRPARSAVAVAALPLGALVEIEAWARVSG